MNTFEEAKKELDDYIGRVANKIDPKFSDRFVECFKNTLHTTISYDEEKGITHVVTGDIPAMWNRDSAAQIRPFLLPAKNSPSLQKIIKGIIKNYTIQIDKDPYANAFTLDDDAYSEHHDDVTEMKSGIWERKFEIDSLCYPVQLSYLYYLNTGDTSHFTPELLQMYKQIVATFITEQNHENSSYSFERVSDWLLKENPDKIEYETLKNNGRGTPVKTTGLIWSGFRPSDDACKYHYLVPSNIFAVIILEYIIELTTKFYNDNDFVKLTVDLRDKVKNAINEYAVIDDEKYGKIFAYEVDGLGNYLLMDDANVPSLLSIPYLGYKYDKNIYQNTRNFILSDDNPFYYKGKISEGIGSPHTPPGYAWHIGLGMRGLTANNREEIDFCLEQYRITDCGCGLCHEGFNVDNPKEFTREWFSWSNSIFVELLLKDIGEEVKI